MIYVIEHRIHTLAENAALTSPRLASFNIEGVDFSHWDFNTTNGWSQDFWLAKAEVSAENYQEAFVSFRSGR
jgi:hypothetical protein